MVSRAFNNNGYVSEAKKKEIFRAADELNYMPNKIAVMLKANKTMQILLSIPDMKNNYYFDIISAISAVCLDKNYSLLINYHESRFKTECDILTNLSHGLYDGLILVLVAVRPEHVELINSIAKPVTLITNSSLLPLNLRGNYDFAGIDTNYGLYLSCEHMIRNGHTRIAYMGLNEEGKGGKERLEGYKSALEDNGIDVNGDYIYLGGHDIGFGYASTMHMLDRHPTVTAVCACNDPIAFGVYKALRERSRDIPKDISVIGMDNNHMCEIMYPQLCSVSLSADNLGTDAANLVFDRISDPKKDYVIKMHSPKLIVRDSVLNRTCSTNI
jgi:DNA-binding LacI/PurR family transcriptional regulator